MKTENNSGRRQEPRTAARGATYVVDLRHFLDQNGLPPLEAPKQLLKAIAFYGSIIEAGSSHPVGTQFPSALPCRRRSCSGQGLTIANARDEVIYWECPRCGENGCISHWQGSNHDLSGVTESDQNGQLSVFLSREEHKLLRETGLTSQEETAIVAGGMATPVGILISGRPEDIGELLGSLTAEANHTKSARRRGMLHGIFDRIEKVVAESDLD